MQPADSPEILQRFHAQLELVEPIGKKLAIQLGIELDDLMSYGREGLLDACRRFDPERGVPFRAFASYRIRGAMLDGMRAEGPLGRRVYERVRATSAADTYSEGRAEDSFAARESRADADRRLAEHLAGMATAMALGFIAERVHDEDGEVTFVDSTVDPEEQLSRERVAHRVRSAIDDLPEQEAALLRAHYFDGERFEEVAARLGLSKSWASRLHARAVDRLSKRLRDISGP